MRWAGLLFCYLFLAVTLAGVSAPLLAADLNVPRQSYPDDRSYPTDREYPNERAYPKDRTYPNDRSYSEDARRKRDVAQFCYTQGRICRKVCDLNYKFDNDFNGCPQSCESRAGRCTRSACFRWTGSDFLIAQRFGGYKCADQLK